ncbi:MAG: Asp-tRNA(Asn)/Glu-tRNA(Gln) amidotransferase subunit GatB [Planctomycetes bacterium]|nr:Asp-tRNA(Asn)/Glu-tRNA(Gln) amidotransferase subunit GatB [Planctomycetota bacterium]
MEYEAVIGLETHAELATETKLFCGCGTRFGAEPNSQTCPVCIGMPGVLPVMNRKAFECALKVALALNCQIRPTTRFDRKNYYYPDLPKNYQISQNCTNLGTDGYLDLQVDGQMRRVGITNVHLEEDAGKSIHPEDTGADFSLIDLNRAGIPLLEIVTAPDMRSAAEVDAYMQTLRNTLLYLGVSECKMQEGDLRFEASISVRPKGATQLGNRVEVKNLNSMKAVVGAVEHEIERQTEILRQGGTVARETRLWDEVRGCTERMRSKEEAHDYRYFPEPDLVQVEIHEQWLADIRAGIPELPLARRRRFTEQLGLSEYDASILAESHELADYFEACLRCHNAPKPVANWIANDVLRELKEQRKTPTEFVVKPDMLAALVKLVEDGTISVAGGREVFAEMCKTGQPPQAIVEARGLAQVSDSDALNNAVVEALRAHPAVVADYKRGKKNAGAFIVGQIMKATKGKANPKVVSDLVRQHLDKA